jgi:hypothetical protein
VLRGCETERKPCIAEREGLYILTKRGTNW